MVCTKLVVRSLVVSLICGKRFALISRYWFSIPGITCLPLPTRHPSIIYPSSLHNDPRSQQRVSERRSPRGRGGFVYPQPALRRHVIGKSGGLRIEIL